jgi:hypothetical protein
LIAVFIPDEAIGALSIGVVRLAEEMDLIVMYKVAPIGIKTMYNLL